MFESETEWKRMYGGRKKEITLAEKHEYFWEFRFRLDLDSLNSYSIPASQMNKGTVKVERRADEKVLPITIRK